MSSRREEERNEKIIRGLLKLPPNRRCINCNSLGPQYVCINFWTFICIACSGIHREFTHRVKSVSMAKFTTKEVEALQRGGNQHAREIFLSEWDFQRSKLPDSSKPDKIREFIKSVYMDKKYAGGRSYDKPPRDVQGHKNIEEDQRRASSYHSYSQSPPYDHQYEDRRYGKQAGILSRKPGSDRGLYEGKLASFICSPGRLGDQIYEDRFANEISGPRMSDYSASSAGDTFKLDGQSPNFESDVGYSSPQPIRDILIEDGHRQISYPETIGRKNVEKAPLPQRTKSSGSFGSFDSNSASLITIESDLATPGQSVEASFTSGPQTSTSSKPSSPDSLHFPGSQTSISEKPSSQATLHPSLVQSQVNFSASSIDLFAEINESTMPSFVEKSSPQLSVHGDPGNVNLFGPTFVQKTTSSSVPLDLFANINQPLSSASLENASAAQFSQEKGWATFDVSHAGTASQRKATSYSTVVGTSNHPVPSLDKQRFDPFASPSEEAQWLSAQNSISHDSFVPTVAQWNSTSNDVKMSSGPNSSQGWNALDDSFGNFPHSHSHSHNGSMLVNCDVQASPTVDLFMSLKVQEEANKDGLQMSSSAMGNSISLDNSVIVSSFDPSMSPTGASCQERKSTNPFDLPFESDFSDLESSNGFLDMSSLQANLPPVQFPSPFISSLAQPWYSQNAMPPYISSVAPGSLAYVAGQSASSPLPDMPPPGPVAPLGGNPFA